MEPLTGHALGEFFAYEGFVAQYRGSWDHRERPALVVCLGVSTLRAEDYAFLLGRRPWSPGPGWSGEVTTPMGGRVLVRCDDWARVEVERPVPKPRDGRDHGWRWDGALGRWDKDYFPRCAECAGWHDPAFGHCDRCGKGARTLVAGRCARCRREAA